jgi:hypothetical protein
VVKRHCGNDSLDENYFTLKRIIVENGLTIVAPTALRSVSKRPH